MRTKTTLANIRLVEDAARSCLPVLLEGNTGVGKTATILEAALAANKVLVQFNLSSTVCIDDLLGKAQLTRDSGNSSRVQLVLGPFAKAFRDGCWLLLDELNLAPDAVLQCIENALDTKQLTLDDPSNPSDPVKHLTMDPNFRLFCTQNPSTGLFKGKRERLSASFLDRFSCVIFSELPDEEWVQIVADRLGAAKDGSDFRSYAAAMVDVHMRIHKALDGYVNDTLPFHVTIRELLKLTARCAHRFGTEQDPVRRVATLVDEVCQCLTNQ